VHCALRCLYQWAYWRRYWRSSGDQYKDRFLPVLRKAGAQLIFALGRTHSHSCPRLKRLTLGTPTSQPQALTHATVLALAQHCPQLDTLDLRDTEMRRPLRITESALLTLVERCRKLRRVALPLEVVSAAAKALLQEDRRSGRRLHQVTQLGWM
jgi:hypothetical protein